MELKPNDFIRLIRELTKLCDALGVRSAGGRLMLVVELLLMLFFLLILGMVLVHELALAVLALVGGEELGFHSLEIVLVVAGITTYSGALVLLRELLDRKERFR